jgi:hypothetical protein
VDITFSVFDSFILYEKYSNLAVQILETCYSKRAANVLIHCQLLHANIVQEEPLHTPVVILRYASIFGGTDYTRRPSMSSCCFEVAVGIRTKVCALWIQLNLKLFPQLIGRIKGIS